MSVLVLLLVRRTCPSRFRRVIFQTSCLLDHMQLIVVDFCLGLGRCVFACALGKTPEEIRRTFNIANDFTRKWQLSYLAQKPGTGARY